MCQICGEKSGYYPLCLKHNNMRKTGEVAKCEDCKKWYLTADECSLCERTEKETDFGDVVFVSDEDTAPLIHAR